MACNLYVTYGTRYRQRSIVDDFINAKVKKPKFYKIHKLYLFSTINVIMIKNIRGLSRREVEIIAWLEFYKKYFFTSKEVTKFFKNKNTLYRGIQKLLSKKRIIKLNQNKYYLVPIKAKSGSWSEHPFIIIDEMCNGKDYYINGWASANYWDLTDQVPMAYEVYASKKQGVSTVLNTKIIFHRIRKIDQFKTITRKIGGHPFIIMNKKYSKKWIELRE